MGEMDSPFFNTSCGKAKAMSMLKNASTWGRFILFLSLSVGMPAAQDVVFTHGVASGDVRRDSAVLWTRVDRQAALLLDVCGDRNFVHEVRSALALATRSNDFTAKVEVTGLSPDTRYVYRWRPLRGSGQSVVGSFRTAPQSDVEVSLRFAWTGDADGTLDGQGKAGYDLALFDSMADEDLDFWVFLGDTVYQDSALRSKPADTLEEYRGSYKVSRQLRPMRKAFRRTSSYVTWDDHEVQNDYDGATVEPGRYAIGRQAFSEYMPISPSRALDDPGCAGDPIFGVFHWGSEVDLILIDIRSCRSADAEPACMLAPGLPDLAPTLPRRVRLEFGLPALPPAGCLEAITDPGRTLLGARQKQALKRALLDSNARYKFIINQAPIQQFFVFPFDRWEGYAAERAELLNFIREEGLENVFFLSADMHASLYNEVFIDVFADNQVIAREFVAGPAGTHTFQEAVLAVAGTAGLAAVNSALNRVGANCRELDAFAYGLAEIDPSGLTISYRGKAGRVLNDQVTSQPCSFHFE